MRLYKLTDEYGQTYNNTQWGENVTHTASGEGELCGPGWIHAYTHPLLAVLLNSIHADFRSPILWEAEGEVGKTDHGLKVGTTSLTTIKQIPLPKITTEQRVRFAILCARAAGCVHPGWREWADNWMSGRDRSKKAAAWAAAAALAAEEAAARAAAAWAAAWAAACAAGAAERAARACPCDLDLIAIAEEACSREACSRINK